MFIQSIWKFMRTKTLLLAILFLFSDFGSIRNIIDTRAINFPVMEDPDWESMVNIMMDRMDLQQGENVLVIARPGRFNPMVLLLGQNISEAGANYLGTISVTSSAPGNWQTEFTLAAKGKSVEELKELFHNVDLGIMMPGSIPSDPPYKAMQEILHDGSGRTIHFHWTGAYGFNGQNLSIDDEKDAFYQRALLVTDYSKLAESQKAFEETMRNRTIRVTSPLGTNMQFTIGDRPVTKQDGNASAQKAEKARNLIDREIELPAGAVRVAPVEASVEGTIAFPDARWNGQMVSGLVLTFSEGKVVEISASSGEESVKAEISRSGEAGRSFREFALGMNPFLAISETDGTWIPYYGYGAGVVRLSLGDNTELGGVVSGGYVRWNFFTDATVTVGDDVWVKDGKLIR